MLTPIVHDLLLAYAVTLGEILRPDRGDPLLLEFLRREHLDAHDDLFHHLWEFCGGRLEVGRIVVTADSEGEVTVRLGGAGTPARRAAPCVN